MTRSTSWLEARHAKRFARIGRAKLREIAGDPEAYLKDRRAGLHERWVAWVRDLKPLVVLVENIPDVLNAGGRNIAEEIALDLEELGFVSCYTLLNAVHYGVPQTRERMFLIGLRREFDTTRRSVILLIRTTWHAVTSRSGEPPPAPFGTTICFVRCTGRSHLRWGTSFDSL